ncbi:MAG: membrane protein insertase YidC [Verrucomicrobia bacterium]|nr:membrane protein insertase YidC [Cytophagales bacterium]
MDRNQIIGFTLITLLLLLYFWLAKPSPEEEAARKKQEQITQQNNLPKTSQLPQTLADTSTQQKNFGDFWQHTEGTAKEVVLENKDVKITFNTQGGKLKTVLLKKYKTYAQKPLYLIDEAQTKMTYLLPTQKGNVDMSKLYFSETKKGDSSLIFRLDMGENQYIEQSYSLPKAGYEVAYKIKAVGMDNLLKSEPLTIYWSNAFRNPEKDITDTRAKTQINYYSEAKGFTDFAYASLEPKEEKLVQPVDWVCFKQKFFLVAFLANKPFQATVRSDGNEADVTVTKNLGADIALPMADIKAGTASYRLFLGANDYQIVKEVADDFGKNVELGYPVINLITRFALVPLFNGLQYLFTNYGLLIIMLVIVVKLVLFPLNYRSYISMAKTRVLAPQMAEIKEKYPEDTQKQQAETMKLYQQVGVNPLSGCIPVLLQMPILLSLFQLFPNLIEFRQKGFLWAEDLSAWDSVATLPFSIPFGYGDHVSLFTILMTASTLAYTYFMNQNNTQVQQGPIDMRVISYVSPLIFMFVLNKLPAGLNFYYFVSNVVSILQQLIIRRFVDEEKIKQVLEANKLKNKDKPKGKFAQKLEETLKAAEEQRKLQEQQKKSLPNPRKDTSKNKK